MSKESGMSISSTAGTPGPLLQVRGLTVTYGGGSSAAAASPAADGVSLTVHRGEIVAVVGESGSGKSTLAKAIIGLLPEAGHITAGSIEFDGEDLAGLSDRGFRRLRGRRIGLVPQDPGASLDPVKTIGAQVAEIFRLHPGSLRSGLRSGNQSGEPSGKRPAASRPTRAELRAEVIRLLELVGINRPEERLHQYPHELSGGLKQRVLIAIAFALKPDLLIADEPTSALDVTVQGRVLEVFERLARKYGTAVLFVTHDLAVATDHASRVVVMNGGRIREDRPVLDILTRPEDPYTVQLLGTAFPGGDGRSLRAPEPPSAVPAVEVRDLVKIFSRTGGEHRAVDGVSFAVRAGSTFALVGESGSGKSTTARLIMRLLDPTGGSIRIAGQDVTAAAGSARRDLWRGLQLVYQNPDTALDPRLSVAEIIGEPLRNFGLDSKNGRKDRVAELLDQVRLPRRLAGSRPMELSGGQRQRVAIARALAPGAGTLVLDEALSALDVLTQAQILDLLQSLQDELGLSYLFISHDLHVVERVSDDVGVMHNGQLVETGPTAEVFGSPASEYTQRLLAANPGHLLREVAASRISAAAAPFGSHSLLTKGLS